MPRYEAIGKHFETGRKHNRSYKAVNETEAIHFALKDGIITERISLIPEEGATDAQLAYAHDLGIAIPASVTMHEISDLISAKVENDKQSSTKHQAFAKKYGVEFTEYIGKKDLFNRILETLKSPGRERELTEWFTYRVYRELMRGADGAPIDGPEHPIIKEIAGDLSKFENVVNSIRRYRGRDLIWFGGWTAPNGETFTGGSERTIAYKMTSAALKRRINFPESAKKTTKKMYRLLRL